jgi:hypothetical protein
MTFLIVTATALYVLGMALVFGGTAALSFAAAPITFRTLPSAKAGLVFGRVLAVFDAMAGWASLVAVVAAMALVFVHAGPRELAAAVSAMAIRTVVLVVRKSIAPRMAALKPPETEEEARVWDPAKKAEFDLLHTKYVRLYATNLFVALAGLVVIALPA